MHQRLHRNVIVRGTDDKKSRSLVTVKHSFYDSGASIDQFFYPLNEII